MLAQLPASNDPRCLILLSNKTDLHFVASKKQNRALLNESFPGKREFEIMWAKVSMNRKTINF